MKWLVTAFAPFNGLPDNSSLIALNALAQKDWRGQVDFFAPVPVTFKDAWSTVKRQIGPDHDGILALGQADTRSRISLERVALNWVDARVADNSGLLPQEGPICSGPELLWSEIPWQKLGDSPRWEKSYSAGTYVCNTLMYHMLAWAKSQNKVAGFVHVPLLQSQKSDAPMPDQDAFDGLSRIVQFLTGL